ADLVCFGVPATRPHTGYGYIELGEPVGAAGARRIVRFTEKPDAATAESFVAGGRHAWNAGIFLFRAGRILDELAARRPEMLDLCRAAVAEARVDLDFVRLAPEPFTAVAGESIDYAVMEHVRDAAVVALDAGWSDIGSWSALHAESAQDPSGNTLIGDVLAIDCRDSYVRSEKPLVATVGLAGVTVIATDDAVLVADASRDQEVKAVVALLQAQGRKEAGAHSRVHRPWGWFQSIDAGPRYQVKHILVKPGESISLQMHHHRSEHWVVVEGTAEVTRGDAVFLVRENESTYIKAGVVHRLHNPGRLRLRLIEVQSGAYLGEDDIVRLEDAYGRLPPGLVRPAAAEVEAGE
ncbi:MAG: mannose-1-phosphate guanylyltransferase/mannose-6-phosphate isomerase, partial [Caenispirillum sp.]|nr:mannose-1-phosphate guanylyltransferase/mannose-6-phosphate isomerase [Caenispirillum sp.]